MLILKALITGVVLGVSLGLLFVFIDFKFFQPKGEWFYSPEEYQMLYALGAKKLKKAQNLARKFRHNLVVFARAKRGKYKKTKKNWHS